MRRSAKHVLLSLVSGAASVALGQGMPLGGEFRVNTFTTTGQSSSAVVPLSGGGFVVAWQSGQEISPNGIFGQRYAPTGAPSGGEFQIHTFTTNSQAGVALAALPSGFVATWGSSSQDGSGYAVVGQRFASSGAPSGSEFPINTTTSSSQFQPAVSADASGNFVVVWTSSNQDGSGFGVFGQRFAASGSPVGGEFQINTFTTSGQYEPRVASDTSGGFIVVWSSQGGHDGNAGGVFGQRYGSSGAPLGGEFQVNTFTTGYQAAPDVAVLAGGAFVVVWESGGAADGSSYGIFGQRYAASGAPVGGEFRINTYTTDLQNLAAVAADASGNFVVAWASNYQYGGRPAERMKKRPRPVGSRARSPLGVSQGLGVFAQRYASTGAPQGPEFRVNTYTSSGQFDAHVALDSTGTFVVVWSSYGQDGNSDGVFGQRYGTVVPVELTGFSVE